MARLGLSMPPRDRASLDNIKGELERVVSEVVSIRANSSLLQYIVTTKLKEMQLQCRPGVDYVVDRPVVDARPIREASLLPGTKPGDCDGDGRGLIIAADGLGWGLVFDEHAVSVTVTCNVQLNPTPDYIMLKIDVNP
jgi:hypothetical protein